MSRLHTVVSAAAEVATARHRTFLRGFAFRAAGPVKGILDALAIIADLYDTGKRRLPDKVPLRLVPRLASVRRP